MFVPSVCALTIAQPRACGAGKSCHKNIRVPSGTKGAPANKHGSVVPEGTLDFLSSKPSVKTLGYCQRKKTLKKKFMIGANQ